MYAIQLSGRQVKTTAPKSIFCSCFNRIEIRINGPIWQCRWSRPSCLWAIISSLLACSWNTETGELEACCTLKDLEPEYGKASGEGAATCCHTAGLSSLTHTEPRASAEYSTVIKSRGLQDKRNGRMKLRGGDFAVKSSWHGGGRTKTFERSKRS